MDNEYVLLDTGAFEAAIAKKEHLIAEYQRLNDDYDRIVRVLGENWKGKGAWAFQEDAKEVRTNLSGIRDILKIMVDTLIDCETVFKECDSSLGEFNVNPG